MPVTEIESHPYLNDQINDLLSLREISKFTKLIVGTFPVYSITSSIPNDSKGSAIRADWKKHAFIQYFYGSCKSHFWELFSKAFDKSVPTTKKEAIDLLNNTGCIITDTIKSTERINHSSADTDLIRSELNQGILKIIEDFSNISIIYFTSKDAKKLFCGIVNIPFNENKDTSEVIQGKTYRLIILITPAGNARSAWTYVSTFPLLTEEIRNRAEGKGYALAYRQRYYKYFLNM